MLGFLSSSVSFPVSWWTELLGDERRHRLAPVEPREFNLVDEVQRQWEWKPVHDREREFRERGKCDRRGDGNRGNRDRYLDGERDCQRGTGQFGSSYFGSN